MQRHKSREYLPHSPTFNCGPQLGQAMESRGQMFQKQRQTAGAVLCPRDVGVLHESKASAILRTCVWACRPGAFVN